LLNLNFGSNDILLIDPLSNNTFCGTDSQGNLIDPQKIDNIWHIPGELSIRPKPYIKNILVQLKKISDSWPDNKIILMVPILRYLHKKCCDQQDHITNFGDPDFQEVAAEIEKVSDLLTAWLQAGQAPGLLVDFRASTDIPDAGLVDLTIDGQSIWMQQDPVHPAPALYSRLAESIYASLDELDAANVGGAPKRPRLESIVVKKSGNTGNKIVSRQSWSAGILPANSSKPGPAGRGRGRGAGQSGWPRRGRGWGGGRKFFFSFFSL
jgi:lysophospholipase L1-like esterase